MYAVHSQLNELENSIKKLDEEITAYAKQINTFEEVDSSQDLGCREMMKELQLQHDTAVKTRQMLINKQEQLTTILQSSLEKVTKFIEEIAKLTEKEKRTINNKRIAREKAAHDQALEQQINQEQNKLSNFKTELHKAKINTALTAIKEDDIKKAILNHILQEVQKNNKTWTSCLREKFKDNAVEVEEGITALAKIKGQHSAEYYLDKKEMSTLRKFILMILDALPLPKWLGFEKTDELEVEKVIKWVGAMNREISAEITGRGKLTQTIQALRSII